MAADNYVQQVRLLVQVLPFIAEVLPGFQWQGSDGLRSSLPQKKRIRVR